MLAFPQLIVVEHTVNTLEHRTLHLCICIENKQEGKRSCLEISGYFVRKISHYGEC